MRKVLAGVAAGVLVALPLGASGHPLPDPCRTGFDVYQAAKSAYIADHQRSWIYIAGPLSFKTLTARQQARWEKIAGAAVREACWSPPATAP